MNYVIMTIKQSNKRKLNGKRNSIIYRLMRRVSVHVIKTRNEVILCNTVNRSTVVDLKS